MSEEDSDVSQDVWESVQDAVGRKVKLNLIKKVKLEVKSDKLESRILGLAPHRVFLLTSRVPAKVEQTFSFFDIQGLISLKQNQLVVECDRGQVSLRFGSVQDSDDIIGLIGTSLLDICPGLNPLRIIKKLVLKPDERITSLRTLWENHNPSDTGACGGFSRIYWCVCDQLGVSFREEVQWDVDTIYLSQDCRELNLQDFIHLDSRDLMAIIAALEFNQWFLKLSIKDYRLTADLCEQILRVVSRSTRLEELTLDTTGLKSDFGLRLAGALSQNPNSALHTINLANNSFEDKGVAALSSGLCKLTPGVKQLDLSKNSLTAKGVNFLAQCFCSNPSIYKTLTHLNLSGNTLRGDDMPHLWNFLSQSNSLQTLDMSNSECSLDLVCTSLLRGSLKHLSVLNLSKSVFSYKRLKDCSSLFKQYFSSALSLRSICLSGTKLPADALKCLLLGLACNPNLRDISLDISGCELRSAGAQILEGCIAEIPNITSLDISDNGLDSDLSTLLVWLRKNHSIRHLSIGKNFNNIKTKNLGPVLESLVQLIQEEESPLMSLSLADSRLKADLAVVLNAVGSNSSLTHLDVSGNSMGDFGAKMLAKALQINTKLRTVIWDRNGVTTQGLQDVAAALEKNYTIRFMPVPIIDAAQALKSSPDKTEDALLKIEQCLLRNHESRRYLQEQAFRLQQGIVTSTTQHMIGQVCVQIQDQLNSLRFSTSERVQQDIKTAEKLMRDAKNSRTLLSSLYHLRSGGRAESVSGSESVCVKQVQEKLCSAAEEISAVIDQQLQSLFVSMVGTAGSVCPHVMQQECLNEDLLHASEGRMTVPKAFITSTLLDQTAIDIINKISEVKLSMASFLCDSITDEILQALSHSQHTLAGHLSRRGQPLLHQNSQDTEVLDERYLQSDTHPPPTPEPQATHKAKRKTIHSRMLRPISQAFELGFDLEKSLEDFPIYVEDLPPPSPMSPPPLVYPSPLMSPLPPMSPPPLVTTPPVVAGLEQRVSFSDLPKIETPSLQHITKSRPRRSKRAKPSRATSIRKDPAGEINHIRAVDQLDEGVPEFFSKKVTNIGAKPCAADTEQKRESRMSGFFSLIKHHSSTKATPTSPKPSAVTTTQANATPPEPVVTVTDPRDPVTDPREPVKPEVKGQVQGCVKHPLVGHHLGVQVLGNDMLAEIRAKQDKRKKERAGVPPSVPVKAERHDEGDGHATPVTQRENQSEPAARTSPPDPNTLSHTPAQTPTHTPTLKHTHTSPRRGSGCGSEPISPVLESSRTITPPPQERLPELSTGDSSPALPPPPPCPLVELSAAAWAEQQPVTHSSEGGDSPDITPAGVSVFETDPLTHTEHSLNVESKTHPTD